MYDPYRPCSPSFLGWTSGISLPSLLVLLLPVQVSTPTHLSYPSGPASDSPGQAFTRKDMEKALSGVPLVHCLPQVLPYLSPRRRWRVPQGRPSLGASGASGDLVLRESAGASGFETASGPPPRGPPPSEARCRAGRLPCGRTPRGGAGSDAPGYHLRGRSPTRHDPTDATARPRRGPSAAATASATHAPRPRPAEAITGPAGPEPPRPETRDPRAWPGPTNFHPPDRREGVGRSQRGKTPYHILVRRPSPRWCS